MREKIHYQFTVLEKGYKSNERIIELVNDMLNVSRIEEGRFGYVFSDELSKAIAMFTHSHAKLHLWDALHLATNRILF